ncbi:hypothetical protein GS688_07805 [Rhodococcus hoagii]|uniref:hypothetical protein n=1 Tax=Rhodococcus hoagii TaxID=43767 RepID=UPI000A120BD0|nr:hypothetical protein [Prescottella equi]NKR75811.1 hypothetical protein [Prescottella equi]NKR75878.1 hypothetical protein [Prescottella equi]NKT17600.1 hypothetical protein [Prescottella equi]ORL38300.1 hypothetical protein A6I87_02630 [Prescottella equi]
MTDHLDRAHIRLLVDRLDQIAHWVHDELENAITCQVAFTDKTLARVTSDSETPLMFNERASNAAHELLCTLRAWTNYVATEKGLPWPGDGRAPHFAHWLSRHIYDVAGTDRAGDAYTEIVDAYNQAIDTIDRPAEKTRVIDDAKVHEARAWELHRDGIQTAARQIGGPYTGLTARRVRTLARAGRIQPIRCVVETRAEIYRLGDVLDAHLAHPTRQRSTA